MNFWHQLGIKNKIGINMNIPLSDISKVPCHLTFKNCIFRIRGVSSIELCTKKTTVKYYYYITDVMICGVVWTWALSASWLRCDDSSVKQCSSLLVCGEHWNWTISFISSFYSLEKTILVSWIWKKGSYLT